MFDMNVRRVREASPALDTHGLERLSTSELARAEWRKSSWSSFNGNCVEVAELSGGQLIGVRDTKDVGRGPVLIFKEDAWRSFLAGVKKGV
jgi:hypothetical protein